MRREITRTIVEEGQFPDEPDEPDVQHTVYAPQVFFRAERMIWVPPTDDEANPKVTLDDVNWRLVGRGRRRK